MWDRSLQSKQVKTLGCYWILLVLSCFSSCCQNKWQSRTNCQCIMLVCYWFQWDNLDRDSSLITSQIEFHLFVVYPGELCLPWKLLPVKVCLSCVFVSPVRCWCLWLLWLWNAGSWSFVPDETRRGPSKQASHDHSSAHILHSNRLSHVQGKCWVQFTHKPWVS